jgi:hypothetical protein
VAGARARRAGGAPRRPPAPLHDELVSSYRDAPTAVLSTQAANAPALALYAARQWEVVVPRLRFASGAEPYAILGRDLPLQL